MRTRRGRRKGRKKGKGEEGLIPSIWAPEESGYPKTYCLTLLSSPDKVPAPAPQRALLLPRSPAGSRGHFPCVGPHLGFASAGCCQLCHHHLAGGGYCLEGVTAACLGTLEAHCIFRGLFYGKTPLAPYPTSFSLRDRLSRGRLGWSLGSMVNVNESHRSAYQLPSTPSPQGRTDSLTSSPPHRWKT